jgi:hypothetical protein
VNERTRNVYENKGEESKNSKVEESRPTREPSGNPGPRCEVLDSHLRKMNERTGNVYENKGSALSGTERSGNVIENKGSYALKPGML